MSSKFGLKLWIIICARRARLLPNLFVCGGESAAVGVFVMKSSAARLEATPPVTRATKEGLSEGKLVSEAVIESCVSGLAQVWVNLT